MSDCVLVDRDGDDVCFCFYPHESVCHLQGGSYSGPLTVGCLYVLLQYHSEDSLSCYDALRLRGFFHVLGKDIHRIRCRSIVYLMMVHGSDDGDKNVLGMARDYDGSG